MSLPVFQAEPRYPEAAQRGEDQGAGSQSKDSRAGAEDRRAREIALPEFLVGQQQSRWLISLALCTNATTGLTVK